MFTRRTLLEESLCFLMMSRQVSRSSSLKTGLKESQIKLVDSLLEYCRNNENRLNDAGDWRRGG